MLNMMAGAAEGDGPHFVTIYSASLIAASRPETESLVIEATV